MRMQMTMQEMMAQYPRHGKVEWIGLRPARREPLNPVQEVEVSLEAGLVGDRWVFSTSNKRQVTLIQAEHIEAVASLMDMDRIDPSLLRRNIVVRGVNLLSLKGRPFRIGTAVLEMTGLAHPCSRMEENLGTGGYNAMRGHGGITARVLESGLIRLGDAIVPQEGVLELGLTNEDENAL